MNKFPLDKEIVMYCPWADIVYTVKKSRDFLFSACFSKHIYCYYVNGTKNKDKDNTYYQVDIDKDIVLGEI